VQVRGSGCIDLGDRRSGVQISTVRQTNTLFEQAFVAPGFLGGQWEFAWAGFRKSYQSPNFTIPPL
jgi:hypothetical protein